MLSNTCACAFTFKYDRSTVSANQYSLSPHVKIIRWICMYITIYCTNKRSTYNNKQITLYVQPKRIYTAVINVLCGKCQYRPCLNVWMNTNISPVSASMNSVIQVASWRLPSQTCTRVLIEVFVKRITQSKIFCFLINFQQNIAYITQQIQHDS